MSKKLTGPNAFSLFGQLLSEMAAIRGIFGPAEIADKCWEEGYPVSEETLLKIMRGCHEGAEDRALMRGVVYALDFSKEEMVRLAYACTYGEDRRPPRWPKGW